MSLRVCLVELQKEEKEISIYLTPEFQRIGKIIYVGTNYITVFDDSNKVKKKWIIPIEKISSICVR